MGKRSLNTPAARPGSWLDDGMMNMLVDYYTEVQFRPYGSGATRENVVPFLKQLDLGYLCIYANPTRRSAPTAVLTSLWPIRSGCRRAFSRQA